MKQRSFYKVQMFTIPTTASVLLTWMNVCRLNANCTFHSSNSCAALVPFAYIGPIIRSTVVRPLPKYQSTADILLNMAFQQFMRFDVDIFQFSKTMIVLPAIKHIFFSFVLFWCNIIRLQRHRFQLVFLTFDILCLQNILKSIVITM